jgi:hypothetical protein
MGLFKSDLYRALGLGFIVGCAALFAVMGSPFSHKSLVEQVIPSATAATASPQLPDQTLVPAAAQDQTR